LGPLLFILFIDDIKELNLKGSLHLFADDIALVYKEQKWINIEDSMNSDLEKVQFWMLENKLAINTKKSNFIVFGNVEAPDLNIFFENEPIIAISKVKYLGVWIDNQLKFTDHIDLIVKKISTITGILFKLKNILPLSVKKLIYFSLIHSHLTYACEIWGHTYIEHLKKIKIAQKKALKAMMGVPFRSPSFEIFCNNSILPILKIIDLQSCIFIHNIMNQYTHSNTQLLINANFHNHNTRQRWDLHFNNNNSTTFGNRSLLHCSKRLYNNNNLVPNDFKNLNKISFKIKLKKFFKSSFLINLN
jgi:Reverse transcriptase (RNA-dependent DNA polymerase)